MTATASTTDRARTLADAIADMTARRDELARRTDTTHGATIESHGWIVVCDGLAIGFKTHPLATGGFAVTDAHPIDCLKANRLTKSDAIKLAPFITNGAGTQGIAMHWRDAAAQEMAAMDTTIASLSTLA